MNKKDHIWIFIKPILDTCCEIHSKIKKALPGKLYNSISWQIVFPMCSKDGLMWFSACSCGTQSSVLSCQIIAFMKYHYSLAFNDFKNIKSYTIISQYDTKGRPNVLCQNTHQGLAFNFVLVTFVSVIKVCGSLVSLK